MTAQGCKVSDKSVLELATFVNWLGTEVDLDCLSMSNSITIWTRLVACLIVHRNKYVPVKGLARIVGFIGWMGTPATGHIPFFWGGVYRGLFRSRSELVNFTPPPHLWISLASAALIASPPFGVPIGLVSSWLTLKWMAVDAVAFTLSSGATRYRVGRGYLRLLTALSG